MVLLLGAVAASVAIKRGRTSPTISYTLAPVTRGDIVQAVNTTGQLSPWTSVEVSTQISGLVTQVNVDFNSQVKKGQVLARIDPSTYEQRLRQAQADLAAAQASHALVQINTRRLRGLREQDLVTQQEYDQAAAQLQQADAALLTNKAAVENARVDLARCTITSPIDGIVIFKQVEVGKTVVSSFSAPTLFVIAQDMTRMKITASISEVDVWMVHPGQPVTFTVDAIPERTFEGRLTQIRNPYTPSEKQQQQQQAQQNTIANFDGVIEVENPDLLLRPSLTANVSIVVDRREQVLRIPNSALRVQLPQQVQLPSHLLRAEESATGRETVATVYRLLGDSREGTPEAVRVQLGISDGLVTEITRGLSQDDRVITGIMSAEPTGRVGGVF